MTSNIPWQKTIISSRSNIADAIRSLNESATRIVLVVSESGLLKGTVTDGDIRRAILRGLDLNSSIVQIVNTSPVTAKKDMSQQVIRELMDSIKVNEIPILDDEKRLIGLHTLDSLTSSTKLENYMVVMAGGMGKRLHPITKSTPKPLVKISGKPILEHIIIKAKAEGFVNFFVAIQYMGKLVEDLFGNGERLGVNIKYLREDYPLGTAGALSLINSQINSSIVVTNCDVITQVNYREILNFHNESNAAATMTVVRHSYQNSYGIVKLDGIKIKSIEEKPTTSELINAGIYVLDPSTLVHLKNSEKIDMTEFFSFLQAKGLLVIACPIHEDWIDIGSPSDLAKVMNLNVKNLSGKLRD
jgi:dTDP-glucose pyrophosphorylase